MSGGGGGGGGGIGRGNKNESKARARVREMVTSEAHLNVTSMMDIFTVMIFFLIQNFTATPEFKIGGVKLPLSTAKQPNFDTLNVVANKKEIIINEKIVAHIEGGQVQGALKDGTLPELQSTLMMYSQKSKNIADIQAEKIRLDKTDKYDRDKAYVFDGNIALTADQDLTWAVIKKILKTSAQTPYTLMRFAVMQKAE